MYIVILAIVVYSHAEKNVKSDFEVFWIACLSLSNGFPWLSSRSKSTKKRSKRQSNEPQLFSWRPFVTGMVCWKMKWKRSLGIKKVTTVILGTILVSFIYYTINLHSFSWYLNRSNGTCRTSPREMKDLLSLAQDTSIILNSLKVNNFLVYGRLVFLTFYLERLIIYCGWLALQLLSLNLKVYCIS